MVKKTFLCLISILSMYTSAVFLVAGEFTASVSSTQVHMSESFSLMLTLKDASPKAAPAVSSVQVHFLIHSQQHSTNTTIVNGKASLSISWKFSLVPKIEGVVQIPSITVDTAEGSLFTQPITLHVIKGSGPQSMDSTVPHIMAKVSSACSSKK